MNLPNTLAAVDFSQPLPLSRNPFGRLVLHKDGSSWELKNSKNTAQYEKIGKDQVKVTFDSLSPVVFAIDSAEFHVDPNGPTSPQTGEISPVVVIAGMTIVAACAAAYVVRKEKAAR